MEPRLDMLGVEPSSGVAIRMRLGVRSGNKADRFRIGGENSIAQVDQFSPVRSRIFQPELRRLIVAEEGVTPSGESSRWAGP
jgi:hypothetical protein